MKVLKSGFWNDPWNTEVTCERCEAVLEVETTDLGRTNGGDPRFTCPECFKVGSIRKSSIPEYALGRIKNTWVSTGDARD